MESAREDVDPHARAEGRAGGFQSGRKELRKNLAGPKIMSWYHRPIGKDLDPLFVDPDVERKKLKIERLARRGKVTPKKGEGKRAKKK